MDNTFIHEKLLPRLTFNPGLALTGFRTTRPMCPTENWKQIESTKRRKLKRTTFGGKLKRLTPAPRTTHWPPLHGLPYRLLHGLPYGLPLRTTLNNQPNSIHGVEKYKKPACSAYTIITAWKTVAIFFVRCGNSVLSGGRWRIGRKWKRLGRQSRKRKWRLFFAGFFYFSTL